jgi:hypothetical protein
MISSGNPKYKGVIDIFTSKAKIIKQTDIFSLYARRKDII